MASRRTNSRERILAAAADVAREAGPGNLSLEAVASRAGVSKGGLLYNFPTKAKLLQALVETYLADFSRALDAESSHGGKKGGLLSAYVQLSANECEEKQTSASWIFSAIAEDPDFLNPIKTFRKQLFERLKAETTDLSALLVIFLAIEGLRSMTLFDTRLLSDAERRSLMATLFDLAGADRSDPERLRGDSPQPVEQS